MAVHPPSGNYRLRYDVKHQPTEGDNEVYCNTKLTEKKVKVMKGKRQSNANPSTSDNDDSNSYDNTDPITEVVLEDKCKDGGNDGRNRGNEGKDRGVREGDTEASGGGVPE